MAERTPQIAPEVVSCIAEGRGPSEAELFRVADQIWADIRGSAPAFSWGEAQANSLEQALILRLARTALRGAE